MRCLMLLVPICVLAVGCRSSGDDRAGRQDEAYVDPGVWQIAEALTGAFSNAAQADTADYERVQVRSAAIWPDRDDDEAWIYVEQAADATPDRPYRQRVYRVLRAPAGSPGPYASEIYLLPGDPLQVAGAWRADAPLADLTPDDLTLREGCTVYLLRTGPGTYAGQTEGTACASDLRGASYVTSEVTVQGRDRFTSWDRGFDASGQQVWGAPDGPYAFDRRADSLMTREADGR